MTVLVKQHKSHLLWTAQTQLKNNHRLNSRLIPTVLDRFIQQAIHQVLNPLFDPHFSPYSYGFRPNCNAAQAVTHLQTRIKSGRKVAVDIDLSKFFDRVNHDLLMHKLGLKIKDKVLMRLIGRYLRARIV